MPQKIIYGNGINLSGLWFEIPQEFKWDEETGSWWYEGDFEIPLLDTDARVNVITFGSRDKINVINWTKGVKATMTMLSNWTSRNN